MTEPQPWWRSTALKVWGRRAAEQRATASAFADRAPPQPQLDVLLYLAAYGPARTTAAGSASGLPPTTALNAIKKLVRAGLVERHEDRTDRRVTELTLTPHAETCLAQWLDRIHQ